MVAALSQAPNVRGVHSWRICRVREGGGAALVPAGAGAGAAAATGALDAVPAAGKIH